jgi:hypothetical protein
MKRYNCYLNKIYFKKGNWTSTSESCGGPWNANGGDESVVEAVRILKEAMRLP